jgi:hypothetical protein
VEVEPTHQHVSNVPPPLDLACAHTLRDRVLVRALALQARLDPHMHGAHFTSTPKSPSLRSEYANYSFTSIVVCMHVRRMTLPLFQREVFWQEFETGRKEISCNDVGLFRTQLLRIAKMCTQTFAKKLHVQGEVSYLVCTVFMYICM